MADAIKANTTLQSFVSMLLDLQDDTGVTHGRGHQGKQHAPVFSDLPDDATGVAMAEAIKENNMLQSFRTCH